MKFCFGIFSYLCSSFTKAIESTSKLRKKYDFWKY